MAEVRLKNIQKSFSAVIAVDKIDMLIPDNSFVVILGPTGAGKTTLLRLISGLERLDGGEISIGGRTVNQDTPSQRNVSMVFQQYSLYPHMTVRENLEFPLRSPMLKTAEPLIKAKVNEVSEILQITEKLSNKATELSGGEMQRVSIGRALVRSPEIYLMDEPLSSLDAKLRSNLRVELKRIQLKLGSTFLYVTHDQIEAMTMATHVGVLQNGKLVQFGSPREIYENPSSIYVATRLGLPRINIVPAQIFDKYASQNMQMGLRPENILQGAGREAQITRVEHLGDQTRLHLKIDRYEIITLAYSQEKYKAGSLMKIKVQNPLYFDEYGNRVT